MWFVHDHRASQRQNQEFFPSLWFISIKLQSFASEMFCTKDSLLTSHLFKLITQKEEKEKKNKIFFYIKKFFKIFIIYII